MPDQTLFDQSPSEAHEIVNRQSLARAVGLLAMAFPFILLVVGLLSSCAFDSISHYYYGPVSGTVFIIGTSMVAVALFAYSGKDWTETWMANLAALALVTLTVVPTQNLGCSQTNLPVRAFAVAEVSADTQTVRLLPFLEVRDGATEVTSDTFVPPLSHFALGPGLSIVHLLAAGVFISVLAYFCFFIFTRIEEIHRDPKTGELTPEKQIRNSKYRQSGWVIIICLVLLAIGVLTGLNGSEGWLKYNLTYVLEAIAIVAFARSWLLKGRVLMYQHLADHVETEAIRICGN